MKLLLILLLLSGCATRYLSAEEDAEMREACVQGCITVPLPIWSEILNRLQGTRI